MAANSKDRRKKRQSLNGIAVAGGTMKENGRILVIDDDEGIRETYQTIFRCGDGDGLFATGRTLFEPADVQKREKAVDKKGFELTTADNGETGIEKVKQAKQSGAAFAVAFIDMKMPGMNGSLISRKIWEIDPDIKIVIVTAYSEYTPEDIIAQTGREDIFYLRKPFNREEILQFARALANEWNLERKRDALQADLTRANHLLEEMNTSLSQKVEKQAAMIVQSEKMASVGLLAAGVAHEINNPIAFVQSNLTVAKKYFSGIAALGEKYKAMESFLAQLEDNRAKELLKELDAFKQENNTREILNDLDALADESLEGIDRVKAIVKDLRTFSRIDEADYKFADINHAIETTLKMLNHQLKHKVEIDKQYGDLPMVKCFPQKLGHVFMNLLINAEQAIEEKGTIRLTTAMVIKGRGERDRFVEIVITDTGCGIPEENLSKLFDPFFTTKPLGTGTGLGLSIVYESVKVHGGTIEVQSRKGEGTTFTILLPAIV